MGNTIVKALILAAGMLATFLITFVVAVYFGKPDERTCRYLDLPAGFANDMASVECKGGVMGLMLLSLLITIIIWGGVLGLRAYLDWAEEQKDERDRRHERDRKADEREALHRATSPMGGSGSHYAPM